MSNYVKYLPQIIDVVLPFFLVFLSWLLAELIKLIRMNTQAGTTRDALLRLDDAAYAIVSQLAQGTAGAFKEASADGRLTQEEISTIKAEAFAKFVEYLGSQTSDKMKTHFGEDVFETMVKTKIEQAVVTSALDLNQQRIRDEVKRSAACAATHADVDKRIESVEEAVVVPRVKMESDFDFEDKDTGIMSREELTTAKHDRDRKIEKQQDDLQQLKEQLVKLKAEADTAEKIRKENENEKARADKLKWQLYGTMGVATITALAAIVTTALQLFRH